MFKQREKIKNVIIKLNVTVLKHNSLRDEFYVGPAFEVAVVIINGNL